jgi:acetyltransferase
MIIEGNYELIMGLKKDRDFGPVILFGMGGVLTEIIKDSAIALPPLNRLLARRLMEETKVYKLLQGYRNYPPVDISKLEEILIRLAQLAADFSVIEELDINPLIVTDDNIFAVDARITVKPSELNPPLHMVISPYPDENEEQSATVDGHPFLIRPIRPEDAPIFKDLFESLSPRSIYYRFFSPIKSLSSEMLAKFTQIDYDREIALVAVDDSGNEEIMLGVARIIIERNETDAEFSVLVRDEWHGKGIGAQLLDRCMKIVKERGINKVWGFVLSENTQMLALGKKLGFSKKRVPETNEYELAIEFQK